MNSLRRVILHPSTWCLFITLDFILTAHVGALANRVGDPDDAIRLVSVREFLHGASWFDTTVPRIGAPVVVSHWSRLIDAPLALSIGALTPVLGSQRAELLTRVLWPAILLLALQLIVVRDADRRGGAWAAGLALVFAMTSITATVQFSPGRIDHHNAMILCTIGGLLFLAQSMTDPRAGWTAGAFLGLALAIGYEPIALIVPALAFAVMIGIWTGDVTGAAHAMTAATLTTSAALLATVRPSHWLPVHCDTLAINVPIGFACCAAGLWFARRVRSFDSLVLSLSKDELAQDRAMRIGRGVIAGASALVAGALFTALEPACLRGPFAQVSPEVRRLWLDYVMETKNVSAVIDVDAPLGWSFIVFTAMGTIAQAVQARRRSDTTSVLHAGVTLLAFMLGCWQVKLMPYASWLAAMSLAVFVAQLSGVGRLSIGATRAATAVLLNQATLMFVLLIPREVTQGATDMSASKDVAIAEGCLDLRSFVPLARLTPGLVASDLDLGPYIAVTTDHRVVAAPYHRLEAGIIANHAILTRPPDESLLEIRRLGVNYLVLCQPGETRLRAIDTVIPGSLEARLLRHERVDFLNELTENTTAPIRIWEVR